MILQYVPKNAMQAYIKNIVCYDKKANASKLKQIDFFYILQPKTNQQGSKIPFTDFRWIETYFIEKVLPNNKIFVRQTSTNQTQVLHRMGLRHFTPRQLLPDIPITLREWQPDPEVIIKHDDLYARARECEYEKPIFDSDYNNRVTPTSPEIAVQSEEAADEMRSTPGTIRENSPEFIPQTDRSYDGTDTDHCTQPDADTSVEQSDPTPTNPRSSKYDLCYNPKPNGNDDYRYTLSHYRLRNEYVHFPENLELISGKPTYSFERLAVYTKELMSTTDRVMPILAFVYTGNWIFITTL